MNDYHLNNLNVFDALNWEVKLNIDGAARLVTQPLLEIYCYNLAFKFFPDFPCWFFTQKLI